MKVSKKYVLENVLAATKSPIIYQQGEEGEHF